MHFRSRLQRLRNIIEEHRSSVSGLIANLEALKAFSSGREITVIGVLMNKITTKNGNIMVVIDDETTEAKIMFIKWNIHTGKKSSLRKQAIWLMMK